MKFIFLDIDGVLNYYKCTEKSPTGCIGIDTSKVELLKQIVDATNAKIILTSTWKSEWFITDHIEDLSKDARYLIKQLSKHRLGILDKTTECGWSKRGQGIIDYLKSSYCESFVILDDNTFDFMELGLDKYLVKTDYCKEGLTEQHVKRAIEILNTQENTYDCKS